MTVGLSPRERAALLGEGAAVRRRDRRCAFCCCCRTRGRIAATVIVVCVLLGAAVFFLFPRTPRVKVASAGLSKEVANPFRIGLSPPTFDMAMAIELDVYNGNFLTIDLVQGTADGFFNGTFIGDVEHGRKSFKARSTTRVTLRPFLRYASFESPSVLAGMLRTCNADGELPIDLDIVLIADVFSFSTVDIPLSISPAVPCPNATPS